MKDGGLITGDHMGANRVTLLELLFPLLVAPVPNVGDLIALAGEDDHVPDWLHTLRCLFPSALFAHHCLHHPRATWHLHLRRHPYQQLHRVTHGTEVVRGWWDGILLVDNVKDTPGDAIFVIVLLHVFSAGGGTAVEVGGGAAVVLAIPLMELIDEELRGGATEGVTGEDDFEIWILLQSAVHVGKDFIVLPLVSLHPVDEASVDVVTAGFVQSVARREVRLEVTGVRRNRTAGGHV
ncbi:hypothetical protein AGDE_16190 [Angomonas deanei]|nr:hypothetical protein AGDE_16190 [Angomonas deanei]|eukprot:EPY17563.1 hypothetical protein AGDE_16190 [Angomonas deanei]